MKNSTKVPSSNKVPKRRGTAKQLATDALILNLLRRHGSKLSLRTISSMLSIPVSTVADHLDFLISKRLLPARIDIESRPENSLTNQDFLAPALQQRLISKNQRIEESKKSNRP